MRFFFHTHINHNEDIQHGNAISLDIYNIHGIYRLWLIHFRLQFNNSMLLVHATFQQNHYWYEQLITNQQAKMISQFQFDRLQDTFIVCAFFFLSSCAVLSLTNFLINVQFPKCKIFPPQQINLILFSSLFTLSFDNSYENRQFLPWECH